MRLWDNNTRTTHNMEDYKALFQLICTALTIGFFSTGILTCIRIRKEKSVNDINFVPYVMTSLNCLLWCEYGILVKDTAICLVNGTGVVLQFIYIVIYFQHCEASVKVYNMNLTCGAALVFGAISVAIYYKSLFSDQTNLLGLICDVVTILMFASPLSTLRTVLKTKNTSSLSFPLSFMVVLVSISWFFYGTILGDYYIVVPNAIGAALGVVQVSLFFVYTSKSGKAASI